MSTALVGGGALYIALRWRRSPQAYRAIIAVAVGYFVAGALAGAWAVHLVAPKPVEVAAADPSASVPAPLFRAATVSYAAAGTQPNYLPNRYSGKVVGVTDGDTIDVAIAPAGAVQSVRLAESTRRRARKPSVPNRRVT